MIAPPEDEEGPRLAALVADPSLGLALLLPGHPGPEHRTVRWAHTTELIDPAPYLRGGELVCTVGQALVDAAACAAFAASVASADAVGVCFGVGDVLEEVPPGLLQACARHDLALLTADRGTPFITLTEHLAAHRVRRAVAGSRAGQLLELLADRSVTAEALLPALVDAGLGRGRLQATAWPADAVDAVVEAVGDAPHLVAVTESEVLVVTLAGEGELGLDAVRGRASSVFGEARAPSWRDLGAALQRARSHLAEAESALRETGPSDPATLSALLSRQPAEVLLPYVTQLLQPLLDADARRDSGLVATLRAYLAADGSLVDVARTQYLHVNSVRHRLARIHTLTGTDPTTLHGAAAFEIALWGHRRAVTPPSPPAGPRPPAQVRQQTS
ncbi:PucR family transcriptional regulator ligand-binding domain-containing protein [Quadrisphaera sp. KR29]|uniref:PucR family transcriptional regulator ligand-binding domain-containing protein n=1 Tax=Quadrisphaera sp. KR29 TaxID=3461391 RepID=UPI004043D4DA